MSYLSMISGAILTIFLVGCSGTTPPPKTAADQKDTGDGLPVKVQPKRQISGEAKAEFAKVAKAYEEAKKSGTVKSSCDSLTEQFSEVFQNFPKLPEAKFNEGVIWEECGNLQKAEQAYQAVLAQHPNFGPALNNVGQIYFSRGNVGQAVSYFEKAANQKNSEGYANLAIIQRNKAVEGQVQLVKEAIDNIHRALAVDSFNIEAYATMALVLYDHAKDASQLEMARLICVQALKVDDKYAPLYNVLGLILLRSRKVTPALAEFRKAVAIDPNFMEAHMNIGAVTLSFRDYASAETSFTKVLSLSSDKDMKVAALVGLGVAYRGQRKFSEAMSKYQAALKLSPQNVDVIYNMGILIQDYTFDASNPAAGISSLEQAANYLQQYVSGGKNQKKIKDAQKRIKNIKEMIPMLREQQKMMQETQSPAKS